MSARSQSNRGVQKPLPRDTSKVLDEAEMDEALDDTFPASDPPSWTLGVDADRRDGTPSGAPDNDGEE
jgi:hypothetical protein